MTTRYRPRLLLAFLALSALAGCGGGGGGGDSTTPTTPPGVAPVITVGFGVGEVKVTWPAVSGATYYQLYKDLDGPGVDAQFTLLTNNITGTSVGDDVALYLSDWINASYYVKACNSAGCSTASNDVNIADTAAKTPNNSIGYVKSSTAGAGEYFYEVALSGDGKTMAVGAWSDDNTDGTSTTGTGSVYLFSRGTDSIWSEQAYLKAPNPIAWDAFGRAVSLSDDGNTLAVGAPWKDSGAGTYSGAAYIFTRIKNTWNTVPVSLKASDSALHYEFGNAVNLSGDGATLAVGSPGGNSYKGAVYLFTRANGWGEKIFTPGVAYAGQGDEFGYSVALSYDGKALVVGAPKEDSVTQGLDTTPSDTSAAGTAADSGAAYVFRLSSSGWILQNYVKSPNSEDLDGFGSAVTLTNDGTLFAVGAPGEDSSTVGICSGSSCTGDNGALQSGAAYMYLRGDFTLLLHSYIKASNPQAGDEFGRRLALSGEGKTLAIGALNETSSAIGINGTDDDLSRTKSGAAYLFTHDYSYTWSQKAYIKAPNPDAKDYFGYVALSDDGKTLAVGADDEDGNGTGVCATGDQTCATSQMNNDANYAGAVYLY